MSERYDEGLLADYGGGDVAWWHDYIRAALGRSEYFYAAEIDRLRARVAELETAGHGLAAAYKGLCQMTGHDFDTIPESRYQHMVGLLAVPTQPGGSTDDHG